jgi:hypothetical protein
LVCTLGAAPASAQAGSAADPVIAARTLGYQGIEAYQAGNYALADQQLSRAYQLLPVPSLGLWSARALAKRSLLLEASQRYREVSGSSLVAGDPAVQKEAKQDAERELAALLPSIPSVRLQLVGAVAGDVRVSINGQPLEQSALSAPIPVNPGERVIEGRRGDQRVRARVTLQLREQKAVLLDFRSPQGAVAAAGETAGETAGEPAAALGLEQGVLSDPRLAELEDQHAKWRTGGWVAVGVGGGALLLSGVAGLIAWRELDDFDCRREPCVSSNSADVSTYHSLVTASTIGYLAGGLIAGAGLFVLLHYQTPQAGVALGVGPLSASLRARF